MIGVVVDSNSQLSPALAERFGIAVVPLIVTLDGRDFREGVDLDADAFYDAWRGATAPEVSTSQPSPGDFVEVYRAMIGSGCTEILSIHLAAAMSGTLNSARLAADLVDATVEVVDTGTASFGVSCCAWAAAEAVQAGADLAQAAAVAEARARSLRTSFVVGVPRLTDRSGRAGGVEVEAAAADGVPVLAMSGGDLVVLDTVTDLDAAVDAMVADTLAWPAASPDPPADGLRVAIGTSDASSRPVSEALDARLTDHPDVAQVVHYRIGPSVGAHTGPGTAGLFCF